LKTVPDALYEPLFGQPDDTPLHTYAILDAAKFPNLPELLEVSGLVHRCLFKGDAFDELKDAPSDHHFWFRLHSAARRGSGTSSVS
ncbi:MAG: hypothetical protein ABJT31_17080, partial [Hyphomicrobiales bacterium]